jgi:hypothetical protein
LISRAQLVNADFADMEPGTKVVRANGRFRKDAARAKHRVGIVDERFVGPVPGIGGQVFLQVVQFQL